MTLTLTMLRCPDAVPPQTRTVAGGEFSIGRGPENDWVLPDPDRTISKQHCLIAYLSGGWQVEDRSTNGTFHNRESEPIGRGEARDLRDGDRLRFGAYEIELRIAEASEPVRPRRVTDNRLVVDPFERQAGRGDVDPFEQDPLLRARRTQAEDPLGPVLGPQGIDLPADFDPLNPEGNKSGFIGQVQSDHRSRFEDAFVPSAVHQEARDILPEDWDREFQIAAPPPPIAPRDTPPPPPPREFTPPPQPRDFASPPPREFTPPPPAREFTPPPVAREFTPPPPAREFTPPPIADDDFAPAPNEFVPPPPQREFTPPPIPPRAVTPPPVAKREPAADLPADASLLAALLRGAGVPDLHPADPAATMEMLGAALRALVVGLRRTLIARSEIKREFRLDQTMIRSRGNNPLKFSADDEDALSALLGAGRRTDMNAADAVAEALRDIRLHELATVAAMQSAVRALLGEFDPAKLRRAERGGFDFVPMQRKASAWDAFEALHAKITQALADDFDSVFGKAFARAYERALADVAAGDSDA
jgi:type VI secretion system FHA domain protein